MTRHSMRGGFGSLRGLLSEQASSTLILGDIGRWTAEGRPTASSAEYVFSHFDSLDQELLHRVKPEVVLSPLISDKFDALDVVHRLRDLRYDGPYRAITGPIAKPEFIRDELLSQAPFMDVDLIVMPRTPA